MILTLLMVLAVAKLAFVLADWENATGAGAEHPEREDWPSHPYRF